MENTVAGAACNTHNLIIIIIKKKQELVCLLVVQINVKASSFRVQKNGYQYKVCKKRTNHGL